MKIETKYNIGDKVVAITRTGVKLPPEQCAACEGSGRVALRGESYNCPRCNGKRETQRTGHGWVIVNAGTVADIRIEHGPPRFDYDDNRVLRTHVQYFLNQPGSGTMYDEDNLYPTRDEALAECDRRNGGRREASW